MRNTSFVNAYNGLPFHTLKFSTLFKDLHTIIFSGLEQLKHRPIILLAVGELKAFEYPVEECAELTLGTVLDFLYTVPNSIEEVHFISLWSGPGTADVLQVSHHMHTIEG